MVPGTIFVGNDIVDLEDKFNKNKFRDQKFINRVFTFQEQNLIQESPDPDRTLWTLWASKEAGYKIAVKIDPQAVFSPIKFQVSLTLDHGSVKFNEHTFYLKCVQGKTWIHVHAWTGSESPEVETSIGLLFGDQSQEVRGLAVKLLEKLGFSSVRIEGRPPKVILGHRDDSMMDLDLSLSHDGAWGAAAVLVRKIF